MAVHFVLDIFSSILEPAHQIVSSLSDGLQISEFFLLTTLCPFLTLDTGAKCKTFHHNNLQPFPMKFYLFLLNSSLSHCLPLAV